MELEERKKKKTSRLFLLRVFIYILGLFFRLQRDSTRQSGLGAGWLEFESQSKLCVCVWATTVCQQWTEQMWVQSSQWQETNFKQWLTSALGEVRDDQKPCKRGHLLLGGGRWIKEGKGFPKEVMFEKWVGVKEPGEELTFPGHRVYYLSVLSTAFQVTVPEFFLSETFSI